MDGNEKVWTRRNADLNERISAIIDGFEALKRMAEMLGLPIRLVADDESELFLYFHDDYPDMILVDKSLSMPEVEYGKLAPQAGDKVYVLERDEDWRAVEVSGYMFLAEAGGRAIVTPYINDKDDLNSALDYHVWETIENYDTDLAVFPIADCFVDREQAHAALKAEKGEDDDDE